MMLDLLIRILMLAGCVALLAMICWPADNKNKRKK